MQDGERLDQLHPADAKRFCDTVEHSLRVVEGNINTLQCEVDELIEGQHVHADMLQHRSAQCSLSRLYISACLSQANLHLLIQ